jgi:hypothetical protein
MAQNTTARYRANYQDEIDSAALYRALAAAEKNQACCTRVCAR